MVAGIIMITFCLFCHLIQATPRLTEDIVKQCVDPRLNGEYPPKGVAKVYLRPIASACLTASAKCNCSNMVNLPFYSLVSYVCFSLQQWRHSVCSMNLSLDPAWALSWRHSPRFFNINHNHHQPLLLIQQHLQMPDLVQHECKLIAFPHWCVSFYNHVMCLSSVFFWNDMWSD
jgi:hypothetical protein